MPRYFGGSQRIALFLAAGGRCEECKEPLEKGWHADHDVPWSAGGETDVINGRALCPPCNLKKGAGKMYKTRPWPTTMNGQPFQHRKWATEALVSVRSRLEAQARDALIVATPAAGKTIFAAAVVHEFLSTKRAERTIVVVPNRDLRTQWSDAFLQCGMDVDRDFSNHDGETSSSFSGCVVTYQQVAMSPEIFRRMCRNRTIVVFDEIHHAGEELSWGDNINRAFECAVFRLSLSGTPFRHDNKRIPFVSYENDRSKADFSYGYGDALQDGVCRPVVFPSYEGQFEWMKDGQVFAHMFADELSGDVASDRLRVALNPDGDWIGSVLREANDKLLEVRANGHSDAGGLVIARDIEHARRIGECVARIAGGDPVIVTSDDEEAVAKIKSFRVGRAPWIVAVKMVSEGVDIPRLRVAVYATNILTERAFRQAIGRIVRSSTFLETDQTAYFFMAKVDPLVRYAYDVMQERDHVLTEMERAERNAEKDTAAPEDDPTPISYFAPISARAIPDDIISDGQGYTQNEIGHARRLVYASGAKLDPVEAAKLLRFMNAHPNEPHPNNHNKNTSAEWAPIPLHERLNNKRTAIRTLVGQRVRAHSRKPTAEDYRAVYGDLYGYSNAKLKTASEEQLDQWLSSLGGETKKDGTHG